LPSTARGTAAARSGFPSRVRGDPGVGEFNHLRIGTAGEEREGDQEPMMFDLEDNFLKSHRGA
jgi:hypothetical protein